MNIPRLIRTVAHLQPRQVGWRGYFTVRKKLGLDRRPLRNHGNVRFSEDALGRMADFVRVSALYAPPSTERLALLRAGHIPVLGGEVDARNGIRIPWHGTDLSRLALYTLHYCEFASDFALAGVPPDVPRLRKWRVVWATGTLTR